MNVSFAQMLYNPSMAPISRKTYFGIATLTVGILTDLSIGANLIVSQLNISPAKFDQLNNITALFYCTLTPLTLILGILGHSLKNDSKILSRFGLLLAVIPFLILFTQLLFAIKK